MIYPTREPENEEEKDDNVIEISDDENHDNKSDHERKEQHKGLCNKDAIEIE